MTPKSLLASMKQIADKAGRQYAFFDSFEQPTPCVDVVDAGDGAATVRMIGPIITGYNYDRQEVEQKLDEIENLSSIHLIVDSPGGYLDAGVSLYQTLNARRKKGARMSATIEGLAASAAVMPPLASDDRVIEPGSKMMIHRPWTGMMSFAMGDRDELLAAKDSFGKQVDEVVSALDAGQAQLEELLMARTDMEQKDVSAALSGGNTWYSTQAAFDAGLVTAIAEDDEAHVANMNAAALLAQMPGLFIRDELRDLQ